MDCAAPLGMMLTPRKRYHVHIYKVESMAEIDVGTDTQEHALKIALKQKEIADFKEPDNKFVALAFKMPQRRKKK